MPRIRTEPSGRIALVTGAASGIGLATARLAAEQGVRLVLTDVAPDGLEHAAASIRAAGGDVVHHEALDVADRVAVEAFATRVHESVGSVDLVMNVAGISTWGRIEDLRPEHWQRTVDVDLMGPIHVLSAFVPPMIEAGRGGHVVNVSSAAGLFGLPLHAPYSAAKFGIRGVSEVLRFDLEAHGIGVTLVCPGAVRTPLVGTVDIVGVDRENPRVQRLVARFEKHAVSPEHVAEQMLRAVRKGRYLVLTSPDIRLGHLAQRFVPFGYTTAMRLLNRRVVKVLR
ncbi:SDR family oxidoreductase [Aeromicrobium sp. CF4.19]|uniref:SDR family oxidoreductase n=1 Tax=Aeromicrobium sp. CF4.19 TaxID=3373082 RepID=UPI003EE6401E